MKNISRAQLDNLKWARDHNPYSAPLFRQGPFVMIAYHLVERSERGHFPTKMVTTSHEPALTKQHPLFLFGNVIQ
jgi:hypothetical protein